MYRETNPCSIISCDALPYAIFMCVYLCCEDFGDAHVFQLPIGKWRIPRYCKFLNRLHLVKHDFYWIFDVIHPLHLVLISHQISGRYLSLTNVELVHQILFAYPITISFTPWFHYLLIAETTSFFRALFMFLTR